MPRYTYTCRECGHTDVEMVSYATKDEPLPCAECHVEDAYCYDMAKTLKATGATIAFHEDDVSHVERKWGTRPPDAFEKASEGRGSAGGGRSFVGQNVKRWV